MKCKRSAPYIVALHNGLRNNNGKRELLNRLPNFVAHDIIEILYNTLHGNCKNVSMKQVEKLKKQKHVIANVLQEAKKKKISHKKLLYKQKGGFLGAILPIIASFIASAI